MDLALVIETKARFFDRYQEIMGVEDFLGGLHADIIVYAPGELESLSHRPFIRQLLKEGKVIYER